MDDLEKDFVIIENFNLIVKIGKVWIRIPFLGIEEVIRVE